MGTINGLSIRDQLLNHIESLGYSYDNKKVERFIKHDLDMLIGEIETGVSFLDEIKRWIPDLISWQEV